ncbi:hypothetical protein [Leucobacter massiliensis]|uniref:Hydroxylaminobenzene mutase n=1 Tax=Leucobacter massiliensis TaxID=1686285 RepID=A0A2S9QSN1_9MICO|nr:hypothetical protein [Leucobacter massiliensis]PRI12603.1 hypothetical protein B4915_00615 [Leucobacter massiliensis]
MTAAWLVGIGLISVALGALSGFALTAAVDFPDSLRRFHVVDPRRIRQAHLDWIIMGIMLIVVGLAVPGLPWPITAAVAVGGVVNPLTFVPMIFSKTVIQRRWFMAVSYASFTTLTLGLIGAAIWHFAA